MDLKFFYIVELNNKHSAISEMTIAKEFIGQDWITLTSLPFDDDEECVSKCLKFMKSKVRSFNANKQKVKLSYAENPQLNCAEEDIQSIDTEDFDENALVSIEITDKSEDWLMRASVMVYGAENNINRSIH